jgi:hypothetical protein
VAQIIKESQERLPGLSLQIILAERRCSWIGPCMPFFDITDEDEGSVLNERQVLNHLAHYPG